MMVKRDLKRIIILGCIVLLLIIGYSFCHSHPDDEGQQNHTSEAGDETQAIVKEEILEYTLDDLKKEIAESTEEIPIDFRTLWKTNKDIYAWISIDDTDIDYPILHHLNGSPDYYLDHDWKGEVSKDAAIFSQWDYNQDLAEDYATFLYGHNWNNDRMFSTLHYYKKSDYRNKHKEIWIYTPMEAFNYQIVAVFNYSSISFPYYYDITDSAAVMKMYQDIQDSCLGDSWFDPDYQIEEEDHLLFLSTCNGLTGQRFLIGAVRKKDYLSKNE